MLELMLCSMLTILPDYLYRRYRQGKRLGHEITFFSVWRIDGGDLAGSGDGPSERVCSAREVAYSRSKRRIGDDPILQWRGSLRPYH